MSKIEEKTGLKTSHAIVLLIILALNVCWLIAETIFVVQHPSILSFVIVTYIQFAVAVYYAVCGYKKPHGNLMRYLLLFYALTLGVMLVMRAETQGPLYNSTYIAIILLSTYMAGRLNKYTQNIVICLIILVLKFVDVYPMISPLIQYSGFSFVNFFGSIGPITVWLAIAAGYIIRFRLHKDAGLADEN